MTEIPTPSQSTEPEAAAKVRITGHVQGVAFRAWTRGAAGQLGLRGWVRNADDGSVHALIIGSEEAVDEMLDQFWSGPGSAEVRDVAVQRVAPIPGHDPFEILP